MPDRDRAPGWDEIVAVGNLSPELAGPVELAKAVEQLPAQRGMPGGARYELKYDGYLHSTLSGKRRCPTKRLPIRLGHHRVGWL
jgi:hypothetical protein